MFCVRIVLCFAVLFNMKVISISENVNEEEKYFGEEILEVLGISQPNRVNEGLTGSNSALEFLMKADESDHRRSKSSSASKRHLRSTLYSNNLITDEDFMEFERCNNIMTFLSKGNNNEQLDKTMQVFFDVSGVSKELLLNTADLKIYKDVSSNNYKPEDTFTISVFLISNKCLDDTNAIDQVNVKATYRGWLKFDITNYLKIWLSNPEGDFGLCIKVNFSGGMIHSEKEIGLVDISGEEKYKPFMVGCFKGPELVPPVRNNRHKRNIAYSSIGQRLHAPKVCQRMNFTVHFKQLGWNWIIAPERFEAFFCSGDCSFPLGAGVNPTNHAIVQTLMHLKHTHIPKPQCAPTQLSSLSVIYILSDSSYNRKMFRHIVAENCGCQ